MADPNPAIPPLPEPEGELKGTKAQLDRIEKALALLLTKVATMEAEKARFIAEVKPIVDQAKARLVDPKTGKIKWWPF